MHPARPPAERGFEPAEGERTFIFGMGATAQVASLFFLVPPYTALPARPLFGETLAPWP